MSALKKYKRLEGKGMTKLDDKRNCQSLEVSKLRERQCGFMQFPPMLDGYELETANLNYTNFDDFWDYGEKIEDSNNSMGKIDITLNHKIKKKVAKNKLDKGEQ